MSDAARSSPRTVLSVLLLCGVVGFLVHLPALSGGFVWDDIASGALGQGGTATGMTLGSANREAPWIFRPATALLFAGAARVNELMGVDAPPGRGARPAAGGAAAGFHLVSLLVHALTSVSVAALVGTCLAGRAGALAGTLLGGLVFAVHPIHTENVAWIASLADASSTLLLVAALLATVSGGARRGLAAGLGGALFLTALLSKETGVTGIALLPLLLWVSGVVQREGRRGFLPPMLAFSGALALYLALRITHAEGLESGAGALAGVGGGDVVKALGFYFQKLFFPWPADPYVPVLSPSWPGVALIVAATAASAALSRRGEKLYLFCLAWFGIALLPTVALLSQALTVTPVAERYLYLPSVGFALAAGALVASGPRWRLPIAALVLVFAATSFSNTRIWRSDLTLWTHVIFERKVADSALPWLNLGYGYYAESDLDNAEKSVLSARQRLKPGEVALAAKTNLALGSILARRAERRAADGDLTAASADYRAAFGYYRIYVAGDPDSLEALLDAGTVRVRLALIDRALTGKLDQRGVQDALGLFGKVLELDPGNPVAGKRIEELKAIMAVD